MILIAGVLLVLDSELIFGFLTNNTDNPVVQVMAVLVRLFMGSLLITQASLSKFPVIIEVLGWVLVISGVFLALIGVSKFRKLMSWVLTSFKAFGRIAGILAIVFGGFLIYAFLGA